MSKRHVSNNTVVMTIFLFFFELVSRQSSEEANSYICQLHTGKIANFSPVVEKTSTSFGGQLSGPRNVKDIFFIRAERIMLSAS